LVKAAMNTKTAKQQLLVIDDNEAIGRLIQRYFSPSYDVTYAPSVCEGLRYVTDVAPDLILMDVDMPVMNGFEGLREIRAINSGVPVIMMTGSISDIDFAGILAAGAQDLILKPFPMSDVAATIAKVVELRESSILVP
jgi:DNA-binding response OmpR family regulator